MGEVPGSILTGLISCVLLDFLFTHSKASDANIAIIVNSVMFVKNSNILKVICFESDQIQYTDTI